MQLFTEIAFNGMLTPIRHRCLRANGLIGVGAPLSIFKVGDVKGLLYRRYGDYVNGESGKPLFVSLIVYLDAEWRSEWDGGAFSRYCTRTW